MLLPIPKKDEAQDSNITLVSGNNTAFLETWGGKHEQEGAA